MLIISFITIILFGKKNYFKQKITSLWTELSKLFYLKVKQGEVVSFISIVFFWGLIHNAHLRKFLSFCKILDINITYLKCILNYFFDFMSAIVIEAWH